MTTTTVTSKTVAYYPGLKGRTITFAESYYLELLRQAWPSLNARTRKRIFKTDQLVGIAVDGLMKPVREPVTDDE